eukprot:scaffold4440_cov38-Cyclotella_meneghiniana.AAC.2
MYQASYNIHLYSPPRLTKSIAITNTATAITTAAAADIPLISQDESSSSSSSSSSSTTPTVTSLSPRQISNCALPTSPPHERRMQSLASLSPIRARRWEESNNAVRERDVHRRLRQVMTDHINDNDDCSDDEIDDLNDSYSDDLDENANEKPPLSASTKSSNRINQNNNWDVDSLLDKHMREIDDCDFGSFKCDALLDRRGQHHHQQQVKQGQQIGSTARRQHQANNNNMSSSATANRISVSTNNNMIHSQNNNNLNIPQITLSEQSTVSSPGWSANPISFRGGETVGDSIGVSANAAAMIQQQFNGVQHNNSSKVKAASPSNNNDTTAPSATTTSQPLPNQEVQIKQHQLQLQCHQLQSINTTLTSRLNNDAITIAQLTQKEEEARQEAALWEAKYRDDTNNNERNGLLLEDLRGILLQKTKEEVRVLQQKLRELSQNKSSLRSNDNETMERLSKENAELRHRLHQKTPSSPSTLQSEAMERLDRMAQSARESEYKWSARVQDCEMKLDQLRKENTALTKEYELLKSQLSNNEKKGGRRSNDGNNVMDDKRLHEMEGKLQRDRKEMDRLIREKNALLVELRDCRELLDSTRTQYDTL